MLAKEVMIGMRVKAKRQLHEFVPAGAVGTVTKLYCDAGGLTSKLRVSFQLQNYAGIYVSVEVKRSADDLDPA